MRPKCGQDVLLRMADGPYLTLAQREAMFVKTRDMGSTGHILKFLLNCGPRDLYEFPVHLRR